tara:strand:- start:51522 stop:53606 length:2085 start_codon:yes stop_codon:yes gene_type:complete
MKRFITPHIYKYAKNIMPKISETEAAALNSGTSSIEKDLFIGKLNINDIVDKYNVSLSYFEENYINSKATKLCELLNTHEIEKKQDLPHNVWEYIKLNKLMGISINKNYNGLNFSQHAHAKIVEKIATRNPATAVSVMVPNSLGPGELLYHYGTREQKSYYLPRLANGIDVPCFGLTTENSGSDAASMLDEGIVVKKDNVLGIRLTFSKRYITLAPIATLIGIAFKLKDPNNLLTKGKEGITLALIPKENNEFYNNKYGNVINIGDRHNPLDVGFMNGTISANSIFIPMTCIIGAEEKCGYGWNMLMECLGEGRGISLPALAVASGKLTTFGVGGYSRIRKQFNIPIAQMEGVKEKLAIIATKNYQLVSAQHLFNSILHNNEKPPVLSAIMKYKCTEYGRISVNNGMDILGGAGICKGNMNFLAPHYSAIPIAITVEGSNTLTRSLIIFGQGLNRSHPYLLDTIKTIRNENDIDGFNKNLINIIKHTLDNLFNSVYYSIYLNFYNEKDKTKYYQTHLNKLTSNFALTSNLALLLGGKIKTSQYLSGRYSDILSDLYMSYACLWYYEKNKHVKDIDKLLKISLNEHFYNIQNSTNLISQNFPNKLLGFLIKFSTYPFGNLYKQSDDKLLSYVSNLITTDTEIRDLLTENIFISIDNTDKLNQISRCFKLISENGDKNDIDKLTQKIIKVDSYKTI